MIYQLVYSSSATQEFWPDDLFRLVETSRRKNALRAVTGMLLFRDGQFLQLLEGPEREVISVFELVKRDPRHTGVKVLLSEAVADRQFPEWTMGFERLDEAWNVPQAWAMENGLNSSSMAKTPLGPKTFSSPSSTPCPSRPRDHLLTTLISEAAPWHPTRSHLGEAPSI